MDNEFDSAPPSEEEELEMRLLTAEVDREHVARLLAEAPICVSMDELFGDDDFPY